MIKILLIIAMIVAFVVAIMLYSKSQVTNTPKLNGLLVTTVAPSLTATQSATVSPSQSPNSAPVAQTPAYKSKVLITNVPFSPQAPFAEWKDIRFQEGCEEASVLIAIYWVKNLTLDRNKAKEEIIAMASYQTEKYGEASDTSVSDTAKRLIAGYFNYANFEVKEDISLQDIKNELLKGNLVIVPANGRVLNNPHFTAPGPDRHNIVVRGFDDDKDIFITNDPGIKEGELYTYSQQLFFNAIRDYPTGYNLPIVGNKKIMIVVKKS